jgi:uncharacterized membrane protein
LAAAALSYPLLLAGGAALSAVAVHTFFSPICHQIPERSFHLFGVPLAVCARCIGIYTGATLGAFVRAPRRFILRALGLALALNIMEAATEYVGLHGNWLTVRALLGFALGLSVAALVAQATLEARAMKLRPTN